jgi:hypothetical protein
MHRTTILLDEASQRAARKLAAHLDVSPSEAMRRAILAYHERLLGASRTDKRKRRELLDRLVAISAGGDPGEEIRRRKAEDDSW